MPRKAVLEGGKRDEIIYTAMKLFFEKGYETTSIRTILEQVGGEVGMFYHYFKSKEELFGIVVERFFEDYRKQFTQIAQECHTKDLFIQRFLVYYEESMTKFHGLSGNMHWTIQYAMAAKTIEELRPVFIQLLADWGYNQSLSVEIAAGQFLYAMAATLHSQGYAQMTLEDKKHTLEQLADRFL